MASSFETELSGMYSQDRDALKRVVDACRQALLSRADVRGSLFSGFPAAACGVSADIVGRVIYEVLGLEGFYVRAGSHPDLTSTSHAWFEIDGLIIDLTYDQFATTGLSGWIFEADNNWHAQFDDPKKRDGFCPPELWPGYPTDDYEAVLAEALKVNASNAGHPPVKITDD